MAEGDTAYLNNNRGAEVRLRQVGGIWVIDTPDAQTNPWYNNPNYQNPIQYYRTQSGELGATPWTPPSGPAKSAIEQARRNAGVLRVQTQQQYDALSLGQEEARRIEENRRNNMIMGFIPNPLQRFDEPISKVLARSPIRQEGAIFRESLERSYPEGPITHYFPSFKKVNEHPASLAAMGFLSGISDDAINRPTKFVSEIGLGWLVGTAFKSGELALSGLSKTGAISPALAKGLPKAIKYGLGGAYVATTSYEVIKEPDPFKKGEIVGRSAGELAGLGIGAGIAAGWRPRVGMTTQEVKAVETVRVRKEPTTIDLRPVVDLSMEGVNPIGLVDPMTKVATPAERAMLINQYRLTPEEVTLARLNKLSVNDILQVRNRMEIPETYFEPTKPVIKSQQIHETPVKVRVRQMNGFVPDIFSSEITKMVPEARIIEMPGLDYRVNTKTIQPLRAKTDVMIDQILAPDTITTTRTGQIIREETLISTITDQINTNITGQYFNNIFYTETPVKPIVPEIPKLAVPPIFPVPPLFPGGGGGGRSGDRWGFVFREDVSRGDPYGNLFTKFTGINIGLGKKKKTTKRKKTTTKRGKK